MLIQVNGEPQEVNDGVKLAELIAQLKVRADQIAIEVNHEVLKRSAWEHTTLKPNDKIEIVHFVGGGCVDVR